MSVPVAPRRWTAAALVAACVAFGQAPALAQGVPAGAAAFVDLVRANGCTLTEAEGRDLLPGAGLTMDDAQAAVGLLNQGALFTLSDDAETLILVPALCEADGPATETLLAAAAAAGPNLRLLSLAERIDPEQAARLIAVIRGNDCAMSEADADRLLPGQGFTPEEVQDIAGLMLDLDLAAFRDSAFTLSDALCAADPAQDGAQIAMALTPAPADTADETEFDRPAAPGRAGAPIPAP